MNARRDAESGFALVFTMGAIALITAVSLGGYVLAEQTLHESVQGMELNRAYQLASAGLEQELAFFSLDRMGQYPKTVSRDGGSYTASIDDLGGGEYELVVVGTVGDKHEEVLTRFRFLNLWDMNISGGAESSVGVRNGFNGNSTIIGSLYVNGDMEWGASSDMYDGPVFIKDGEWTAKGSAGVGTVSDRVDAYGPVPTGGNYYTNLKGPAPDLAIPQLTAANMADYLSRAQTYATLNPRQVPLTGTQPANQDATYYTVINGNTTFGPAFGTKNVDAIAIDSNGEIWIKEDAVIYVKGKVTFASNIKGYHGAGTIVSEDGFVINGPLVPLNGVHETLHGVTDIPRMDASNCLGLLSTGDIDSLGKWCWVSAAVFLNGNWDAPKNAHNSFRGSMIVNSINIQTTNTELVTQPGLGAMLPEGMPKLSGFTARGNWIRR